MKRKFPWSYIEEGESSRSRLKLTENIISTTSRSDENGSEDDSGDNQDRDDVGNSVDSDCIKKHVYGPKREEAERWPEFLVDGVECCPKCEAMTGSQQGLRALLSDIGYQHWNWYGLQKAAGMGCGLCAAIWHLTEHEDWEYDDGKTVTREEIRIFATMTRLPISGKGASSCFPLRDIQLQGLEARIPQDGGSQDNLFNIVTLEGDPSSEFVPGRRESKELSSSKVLAIQSWLKDCVVKHPSCPRDSTPELPRRVVDVGTGSSTTRLYQSKKGEIADYAALSYCWGGGVQQLTTTTANIHEHLKELPNNLSQTILDAIQTCRSVGIRYLWVDALCIIQDDNNDKLDQISKMGVIYKNSTFTIVAASAEKATEGFLSNAKIEEEGTKLPLYIDDSTSGTIYVKIKDDSFSYASNEPIFQRAWTFQEIILSPRALVFDSYQIYCKCPGEGTRPVLESYLGFLFRCEDLPGSVFGVVDKGLARRTTETDRAWYQKRNQIHIWGEIINEYSQRDVKNFEDRLPALAGIASELAMSWNDTYLAGLWAKTIVEQLGWRRAILPYRDLEFPSEPRKLFASVDTSQRIGSPSWSWITVPYPVEVGWKKEIGSMDARFVRSEIKLHSQLSPFGQVKDAIIVLEARVLNMSDLAVKFEAWKYPPRPDNVVLDFDQPQPDLARCRLVYLGPQSIESFGIFLTVEKSLNGKYRRIGYAELSRSQMEWKSLLSSADREVISIW